MDKESLKGLIVGIILLVFVSSVITLGILSENGKLEDIRNTRREKRIEKYIGKIEKKYQKHDFKDAHDLLKNFPVPKENDVIETYEVAFEKVSINVYKEEMACLVDQNANNAWQRAVILIRQYEETGYLSDERSCSGKIELAVTLSDYAVAYDNQEAAQSIILYLNEMNSYFNRQGWYELWDKAEWIIEKCESILPEQDPPLPQQAKELSMKMVVDKTGLAVGRYVSTNRNGTYTVESQDTFEVPKKGHSVVVFTPEKGQGFVYGISELQAKVRQRPDMKSQVMGRISFEDGFVPETYQCLGKEGCWFKIDFRGLYGYVRDDMVVWDGMDTF